eukprot:TRINITY_DN1386_c0_g1_i6.p2 TRINITY_DN1386_c0_g1~~TRINITY_DN1386_c0_g1_i6.p2  ORF type:complete len:253 (-),score=51.55 TRINITY_DN1386_c0_g1_i6:66-824(-)
MTKSLMGALVGQIVEEGLLGLYDAAPVVEWSTPGDPKQNITIDQLMRMSSGIRWTESYHLVLCLYDYVKCDEYYANLPLVNEPDTDWTYSTGTTMLLSRIMEERRGNRQWTAFDYVKQKLFWPASMHNSLIEVVAYGYPGGGSYGYLTSRDWARFGHLYMRGGDWFGTQIVPRSWVEYSCAPTPTAPTEYGAQWWLGSTPEPYCYMSGFRKQRVMNFPGKDLTIVRNAMPALAIGWAWNQDAFVSSVLACFP